jgi:tRNA threonylcarbamoyladenosine biosynthesis protein TsaE
VKGPGASLVYESHSEEETESLADALAAVFQPGDVISLNGPLGSGKTRLVRALANSLGCGRAFVSSPTFGLVQHYEGDWPIVHIDAYRLSGAEEFEQMGGAELLDPEGLTLIEWAERVEAALPSQRWRITAEHLSPSSRRYTITCSFRDAEARMAALAEAGGA